MGFQPGHKKKGGRKKGTPNKVTGELRTWVGKLISENYEQIEQDLAALTPKGRITALIQLIEYVLPKLSRVEGDTADPDVNIIITGMTIK